MPLANESLGIWQTADMCQALLSQDPLKGWLSAVRRVIELGGERIKGHRYSPETEGRLGSIMLIVGESR